MRDPTIWAICFVFLLVATGCNLFEFTNPASSTKDYVAEGQQYLWDSKYAEAEASFTKALAKDPHNAEARWGRAKARLRLTGQTSISLVSELTSIDRDGRGELPFMPAAWTYDKLDRLYGGLRGVREDVGAVYSGAAVSPELTSEDVALDYAAVVSILGVLALRDTNSDGRILEESDINVQARLESGDLVLDEEAWGSLTPEEQLAVIDSVTESLESGSDAIAVLAESAGIDIDALLSVIDDVRHGLEGRRQGGQP